MLRRRRKKDDTQPMPQELGKLVAVSDVEKERVSRRKDELARAVADRNRWFVIALVLGIALILTTSGWKVANDRFANNVRVEWVKLDPSGGYTVEFYDEKRPVEFFEATIDAKLSEFAEKRFSKRRATIGTDYGFAWVMMDYPARTQFINGFNAPAKAAEFAECNSCNDEVIKTRVVNHVDKNFLPESGSADKNLYTTIIYATHTELSIGGEQVGDPKNKIITLTWRFKTRDEILSEKEQLKENPIGIAIMRHEIQDDPNTILGGKR